MNKTMLRGTSLMIAMILALGVFTPGRASSQTATLMPNRIINLAHFYKPPTNSDASTLASNFGTIVLTGGDQTYVSDLASKGFTSPVPQYLRSDGIQDPGGCSASPTKNQIAYKAGDFCWISQNHPEWFLLDTNGNRMRTSPTSNYYRMDYGHRGWQEYFVTRLVEAQQGTSWSGVFLDNLEASLAEIQNDGLMPAKYPDDASYQAAVKSFLQYLQNNYSLPYDRPVVANIIAKREDATWYDYLKYMNGAMKESWAVDWDPTAYESETKWKNELTIAETTQSQGKFVILVAQGNKSDLARQKFAFASYLLISNGKAAFRYSNDDVYSEIWLYDNYYVNLGAPLGPRYQTGTSWRRDFTNGYVTVDPVSHAATISTVPALAPTSATVPTQVVTSAPTSATVPTLAVTATPTQIPTLTATSIPVQTATPVSTNTMLNDKNAAFSYSGTWKNVRDGKAYNGSFKQTQKVGAYVTLNFTGQKFSVIYKTGPNFGKMDVYVDGMLVGTIDQYSANAVFQQKWNYSGTLTAGPHTLKLVFTGPEGSRLSLDAVSIS